MSIIPVISLKDNVIKRKSTSINNTTKRIGNKYSELMQINEQLYGKLEGNVRAGFLYAAKTTEKTISSANDALEMVSLEISNYSNEMHRLDSTAEIHAGGGRRR